MMPMFLIFGMLILFMIMSSRREKRQKAELLSSLKKNDEVATAAGIVGRIVHLKDEEGGKPATVTLKVDSESNTRITLLKTSVTGVISRDGQATENK